MALAPATDLWMIAGWLVVLTVWAVWGVWSRPNRPPKAMHRHQRAMTALQRACKGDPEPQGVVPPPYERKT